MPVESTYLDSFHVRNTTNAPVTLGDLVNVVVLPGQTIDLLKQPRVTKEKINQSQALQMAVRAGILVIIKPTPQGTTEAEKKAILADETLTTGFTPGGGGITVDDILDEVLTTHTVPDSTADVLKQAAEQATGAKQAAEDAQALIFAK